MKNILLLLGILFLSACSGVLVNRIDQQKNTTFFIAQQDSIYIPLIENGIGYNYFHKEVVNEESGKLLIQGIYNSISQKHRKTYLGGVVENEQQALESAKKKGFTFVFFAKIHKFNDVSSFNCNASIDNYDETDFDLYVYKTETEEVLGIYKLHKTHCAPKLNNIPLGGATAAELTKEIIDDLIKNNIVFTQQ